MIRTNWKFHGAEIYWKIEYFKEGAIDCQNHQAFHFAVSGRVGKTLLIDGVHHSRGCDFRIVTGKIIRKFLRNKTQFMPLFEWVITDDTADPVPVMMEGIGFQLMHNKCNEQTGNHKTGSEAQDDGQGIDPVPEKMPEACKTDVPEH
jgi:hypothetical protein